jgi:hypothetical protein
MRNGCQPGAVPKRKSFGRAAARAGEEEALRRDPLTVKVFDLQSDFIEVVYLQPNLVERLNDFDQSVVHIGDPLLQEDDAPRA